jgi:SNF2 family DNA or RNA helicase
MLKYHTVPNLSPKREGFPFQVDAVRAVKDLEFAGIFHEQGLGKTKIAIDLALTWLTEKQVDCILFITKKSLIQNWTREIGFHSHFVPRILDQDRRNNYWGLNSSSRLLLTHYEICISEEKRLRLFQRTRRVGVICDEAQKIKNPESRLTKALFSLSRGFPKRLILTGTPIANRPYDIWALIKFLDHGVSLGLDFSEFKKRLDFSSNLSADMDEQSAFAERLADIAEKLTGFTVRETKETAGIKLPGKEIIQIKVEFAEKQRQLYGKLRDQLHAEVFRNDLLVTDDVQDILKRMLRLVQVASNPHLVDESYREEPGKLSSLRSLVLQVVEERRKVIVWSSFTKNIDWLSELFSKYAAVKIHGKMAMRERNRSVDIFCNDEACRVLVATPASAKEGLTLTVANTAIFYDRSFSLDDYLQAQDRIHRISQNETCYVYNLCIRDSIDEWIDSLLAAKRLSAELAQGDIHQSDYENSANYEFLEMLREVLLPPNLTYSK